MQGGIEREKLIGARQFNHVLNSVDFPAVVSTSDAKGLLRAIMLGSLRALLPPLSGSSIA